jgi:hypothetical protein
MRQEIAAITLEAKIAAAEGAAVSFADIFPWHDYDEARKVFEVRSDVRRGMPLTMVIEGVWQLEVLADMDKKVGEKPLIGPWMLFSMDALRTPVAARGSVRAGQMMRVAVTGDPSWDDGLRSGSTRQQA